MGLEHRHDMGAISKDMWKENWNQKNIDNENKNTNWADMEQEIPKKN